jgi:energy-coupling factor transporter transmembrane protein EcfT
MSKKIFHDAHLGLLFLIFFISVALPLKWHSVVLWAGLFALIGFLVGLRLRFILQSFCGAFFLSLSIWLLNFFYHSPEITARESLLLANHTALKIWALTWVSLLSSQMINISHIILFGLQKKWLSTHLAYACLAGLHSLTSIKSESKRILLNAKLRGIKKRQRFLLWIPLLIFSLRHAQKSAMSLRGRGLFKDKTFYYNYQPSPEQRKRFVFLFMLLIGIFLITIYLVDI